MDRLLNVPEVAALLGVSRATVYRLVKDDGLPYVKLGTHGGLRFRVQDVERWVEACAS